MNLFRKRGTSASPVPVPKHLEVWGALVDDNRFLRRTTAAAVLWGFLALALASYCFLVALYRPLAFHVTDDGRAIFAGRLNEHAAPAPVEAVYVAREFLQRFIAFNSLTVEADLAQAWNLMTDELREEQERTLDTYRREAGRDFVAFVKEQGIQTLLEVDRDRTEVTDHNGNAYTVRLLGIARTWPLNRPGDPAATSERSFEAVVTLVRCPRTEMTPNGLLVAKVVSRFFVATEPDGPLPAPAPEPQPEE